MKHKLLVLMLALLPLCCAKAGKPNLVLVVIDSLGADAVGQGASPHFDRLAGQGVRFERAIAQAPWNLPSVSSLVTSAYPWQTGKPDAVVTLAEALSKQGYKTAAFTEVTWPLLERGFGTFQNTAAPHVYGDPEANSAAKTVSAALDWIGKQGEGPFFVLVHTYEAHSYFLGKPKHREFAKREQPGYAGRFAAWGVRDTSKPAGTQVIEALIGASAQDVAYVRSLYRGAVAEADAELGRLAQGLERAGLDERTVLVVTSSNGEGFRPELKRVHHGGRLHDDQLHVPLAIVQPGRLQPAVDKSLVSLIDVAPTLLELAGLPAEPRFGGRSLVAAAGGFMTRVRGPRFALRPPAEDALAIAEEATFRIADSGQREPATARQLALYSGWITLIDAGDKLELYDLKADPRQEQDASAQHAEVAKGLREQLEKRAGGAGKAQGPDSAAMEQLRSLGYVQ